MAIRTLRKDKNPYMSVDIAPELQATLNANGMQAHITEDENGKFKLVTMSHNSSQPRSYDLTSQQLDALVSGGSGVINKKAYVTFVQLVKDDYYVPGSYVAARNVNSPVQTGLHGYRAQPGEYGYGRFSPFHGHHFGPFDGFFHNHGWGPGSTNLRRIGNRLFVDNGAPIMAERPDGALKPGEMKSGSYGFYDKGNQSQKGVDVLKDMKLKPKLNSRTDDEKAKIVQYKSLFEYQKTLTTGRQFNDMLRLHGVDLNKEKGILTIEARGLDRKVIYELSEEQKKVLFNDKIKMQGKGGKIYNKDGYTTDERLAIINNVISRDFEGKITPKMLNEKDLVSLDFNEKSKREFGLLSDASKFQQAVGGQQASDVIDMRNVREDYVTGFVDNWHSIGVVDGRALDPDEGFYLPVKGGRRVSVGEIQAYVANDGGDRGQTYKMSAVINGKVYTHDISKDDYEKFLNYDDEYRLKVFDKNFKEVQIKSARNGGLQDAVRSDLLTNADTSTSLRGKFSFNIGGDTTTITQATAWKDEVSGNYVLNVRDGKDAGMWTIKLTEQQYLDFKDASQYDKAKMLETLMPWKEDLRGKVKVIPTQLLSASERIDAAINGNVPVISDKTLKDLDKAKGLGYEPVLTTGQEMQMAKGLKEGLQERGEYAKPKEHLVNDENYNLGEIREQTRKNLQGLAGVNGESLDNIKDSKNWKRGGEHGRDTTVGDIAVDKMRDANGNVVEGKYKMSAVIDGVVVTHEINQKQFDKFVAVNDYQRMKLFDKVFPEVQMKTKEGRGFHLGAAILAAFTVGTDLALSLGGPRPPHPKPEVYASVYSKPGVVSPGAVAASIYEDNMQRHEERSAGLGLGM